MFRDSDDFNITLDSATQEVAKQMVQELDLADAIRQLQQTVTEMNEFMKTSFHTMQKKINQQSREIQTLSKKLTAALKQDEQSSLGYAADTSRQFLD